MQRFLRARNTITKLSFETLEGRRCMAASVTNIGNFNQVPPNIAFQPRIALGDSIYLVDSQVLYRADSTLSNLVAVKDIGTDRVQFIEFNGSFYFQGFDDTNRFELWRSDGTTAGTALVKNVSNSSSNDYIDSLTVLNNRLYFRSEGNLFSTDGTAAGTTQVVDLVPGATDGIANVTLHNSSLYFTALSTLYKSDGTSIGTAPVPNAPVGEYGSLASVPGSLYFNSSNLWRLDDLTGQLQVIGPASAGLAEMNGRYYYFNGPTLWKINETATGVEEVSSPGQIGNLTNFQGTLFFAAGADFNDAGIELWRSDGTTAGTFMVKDIEPRQWFYFGDWIGFGSRPSNFTNFNGQLYFTTSSEDNDSSPANGIWKTDGTAAGTVQVQQSVVYNFMPDGTRILFTAPSGTGSKLLQLGANDQVTEVPSKGTGFGSFGGSGVTINGKQLLFGDNGSVGQELFQLNSDNTLTLIKDITPGPNSSSIQSAMAIGNLFYFVTGGNLWRTDGTSAGTFVLMQLNRLDEMTMVGNQTFLAGEQAGTGTELWKTDGTVAGTVLVKDIGGDQSSNPRSLNAFNGKLYFTAVSGGVRTVWESDGTAAGTKSVISLALTDTSWLYVVQNAMFFTTAAGNGYRVYRTNGTQSGTVGLVTPVTLKRIGREAVALGNTLYFTADTTAYGYELWKVVGTGIPQLVKDIEPGPNTSQPRNLTVFNNKLYFAANKYGNGVELWESSGASATTQIMEMNPGPFGSYPTMLGVSGGVLFISAEDKVHGRELWQVNGVASGVTFVKDILPGSRSSNPGNLIVRGQDAVFSAYNNLIGRELWSVRSAAPTMTLPVQSATDYREAIGPVRLAPQALLDDSDNTTFLGASLNVSLGSSFHAGDQVLLANTSTVSMNLNNVLVSGTVVGTFVTSGAGRDLRVDFTRSATKAQVREVLRAVAFNHTTASPVPGLRNVSFALTDGSSGQSQRTVRINVVPLDTLPVISGLPSTATSSLGSTGFAFAASAVVTDDNFNMAGGELTVHFNNSRDFTRILISLDGVTFRKDAQNNVYRGSVIIGTMNAGGGVGATALRITFNDKVTPAIAQELLRSLKVSTPGSTTAGVRIPWIRISDGSRGFSEPVTRPYISIS